MQRVLPYFGAALAALAMTWSISTQAQEQFKDVPTTHWAYTAVSELQKQKILLGYPDGRFSGQRTLTRFEFAVALKRALESLPAPTKGPPGEAGQAGATGATGATGEVGPPGERGPSGLTRGQIDTLRQLTDMFQKELGGLGMDVRQVMTRLNVLDKRMDAVNERLDKMIQFNGDFFFGSRTDISRFAYNDYGGAIRVPNNSYFNKVDTPHDFHLLTKANLPDGVKFVGDIVASNYLSYGSPLTTPGVLLGGPSTANTNGFPEQIAIYQANIIVPVKNTNGLCTLTFGRFENQVTPLTYYRPDTDPFFTVPWYEQGNYVQDGFKLNTKIGSATTQLWAGTYTGLTTNVFGDFLNRPFVGLATGPRTLFPGQPLNFLTPFTQGAAIANESAGLHVGFPLFKYGELGLTLIDFTSAPAPGALFPGVGIGNVTVYGANLKLNPIGRIQIDAEAAKSVTQSYFDHGDGRSNEDNNAFNLNIGYNSGPLNITTGYQYIDPRFGAPGYWNKIGNWYNPTNVQGPFLRAHYKCTPKIEISAGGDFMMGARNRSVPFGLGIGGGLSTHDSLGRITAGVQFKACSRVNLSADYEGVFWDLSADSSAIGQNAHPFQHFITLGAGVNVAPQTQVKLGWQIGAYGNGAGFGGYGAGGNSANFNVFTAQLNTHF